MKNIYFMKIEYQKQWGIYMYDMKSNKCRLVGSNFISERGSCGTLDHRKWIHADFKYTILTEGEVMLELI